MKKPFIGRSEELANLADVAKLPGAKFIVIKGRRRVGKSRLAKEFGRRHPELTTYYLTGVPPAKVDPERLALENFAVQLARVFRVPKPNPNNWDDLLWHLGDRIKGGKAILILDEINWMGIGDPQFSAKLWRLWETELSQLDDFILILSGSLASWIDNEFSSNTGYLGRISWNMTLDELPAQIALEFFGARRSRISLHEQIGILLVTGGIPRYLEEINPRQTVEENLKRICFSQAGLLFTEYDQLLNDLFQKKNKAYREIIEALAERPLTLEELYKKTGKSKSGDISENIDELEKSGFLMRYHTWNPSNRKASNRYKVRIIDNYMRFYLKAIRPAAGRIKAGMSTLPQNLNGMMGLQFENLILKNKRLLLAGLGIDVQKIVNEGPYFQNRTTKHAGCQIDYMVQTRHSLYIVELKFSREPVLSDVIGEVRKKVDALIVPRNVSVRPVLVHVNGVAQSVVDADYFDRIVDFGALIGAVRRTA